VSWRSVYTFQDAQLLLRGHDLSQALERANRIPEHEEIMECWPLTLALHLKIAVWHEDMRRLGQSLRVDLGERNLILVPQQALLKRLDPTGELSVPTVCTKLQPLVLQY
jgi:hypothetical protein